MPVDLLDRLLTLRAPAHAKALLHLALYQAPPRIILDLRQAFLSTILRYDSDFALASGPVLQKPGANLR